MRKLTRAFRRGEEGQAAIIVALAMAVLLGFAALSVDVGYFMWEKRALQNAADAAALAGALELPESPYWAEEAAQGYAYRNGVGQNGWTLERVDVSTDRTSIAVSVAHPQSPFILARVLDLVGVDVRASAQAAVRSPYRLDNVMPWMLRRSVYETTPNGQKVNLKYDARDPERGNFGPLAIGGRGANVYRANIRDGATVELESYYDTEPGNMVGPTRAGLQDRLSQESQECDSFEEVVKEEPSGTWRIVGGCNPWLPGGEGNRRLVVVPIIDDAGLAGRTQVQVIGLALVFLEDFECSGGHQCTVQARLVKAVAALEGPEIRLGPYNPAVGIRSISLIQ